MNRLVATLLCLFLAFLTLPVTAEEVVVPLGDIGDVTGPSSSVDENVLKLVKDSGYGPTADDVTDDNVESMQTAGSDGTAPVADSGSLVMTDIATESELAAMFAANVPQDAVSTWASWLGSIGYVTTDYQAASDAVCAENSGLTESGDPFDEWVLLDSTFDNAYDCDGDTTDDDAVGFCWAPGGYDTYDPVFHNSSIIVDALMHFNAWLWHSSPDSGDVVASVPMLKTAVRHCTCPGGTCEQGETCTLSTPNVTEAAGRAVYRRIDQSYLIGGTRYGFSLPYPMTFKIKPGDCVMLTVTEYGTDTAGVSDPPYDPDQFGMETYLALTVAEIGARSDKPFLCPFSDSGTVSTRCMDNGVVLMNATGSRTLTLLETPDDPVPWCLTIVNQAGASLTVTPHSNDTIEGETQGSSISNGTQYDKIQLCNNVDDFWSIMGKTGTW